MLNHTVSSCLPLSSISGCCPPWRCRLLTQKLLWLWSISIYWHANLDYSYRHTSDWCNWEQCLQLPWKPGSVSCIVFYDKHVHVYFCIKIFFYSRWNEPAVKWNLKINECWPVEWTLDGAVSHSEEASTCSQKLHCTENKPLVLHISRCCCLWLNPGYHVDLNRNVIALLHNKMDI